MLKFIYISKKDNSQWGTPQLWGTTRKTVALNSWELLSGKVARYFSAELHTPTVPKDDIFTANDQIDLPEELK